MDLYFWNIGNTRAAVDVIAKIDFSKADTLFSIAEYWDVADYIASKEHKWNFLFNAASMRTGLLSSKAVGVTLERGLQYYTRYRLDYGTQKLCLYILHLRSMKGSETDNSSLDENLAREISQEIATADIRNVAVMGDFNLPCFHKIFLDLYHLNSTNYWQSSESEYKTQQGTTRIKFYNPIASFSGDLSKGPPGTYYYQRGSQSQSWHLLDNILISYPLATYVDKRKCGILSKIDCDLLLSANGRPNESISDHLPVKVTLR